MTSKSRKDGRIGNVHSETLNPFKALSAVTGLLSNRLEAIIGAGAQTVEALRDGEIDARDVAGIIGAGVGIVACGALVAVAAPAVGLGTVATGVAGLIVGTITTTGGIATGHLAVNATRKGGRTPADVAHAIREAASDPFGLGGTSDDQSVLDRGAGALEGPEATGPTGQIHPSDWNSRGGFIDEGGLGPSYDSLGRPEPIDRTTSPLGSAINETRPGFLVPSDTGYASRDRYAREGCEAAGAGGLISANTIENARGGAEAGGWGDAGDSDKLGQTSGATPGTFAGVSNLTPIVPHVFPTWRSSDISI